MRAREGEIGRGGGFKETTSAHDRKSHDSDGEEFDDFGRRKRKASVPAAAAARPASATTPASRSGARDTEGNMTERQKAALARLHQKGRSSRASRSRSPATR